MGKLLLLIGLYFIGRFVFRYVLPTVKTYNQIKKNMQSNNTTTNKTETKESLYADKGEYIDYEEIS